MPNTTPLANSTALVPWTVGLELDARLREAIAGEYAVSPAKCEKEIGPVVGRLGCFPRKLLTSFPTLGNASRMSAIEIGSKPDGTVGVGIALQISNITNTCV